MGGTKARVLGTASAEAGFARPSRNAESFHPWASFWGAVVAIALHAALALALARISQAGIAPRRPTQLEFDLVTPKPPEPVPPPPEPPPLPPPPPPKVVHRAIPKLVVPPPPSPMPNRETKPESTPAEEAKPVFGVTAESVVAGDSPVAVPVGNTLMTKDRTIAKAPPPPLPPAPPPPPAFSPVDEESVVEFPEATYAPKPPYPELARRMGIDGKVRFKLGIDRKGNVKSVKILEKAGYGMDEAAEKTIWQYRFKPAKGADGRPVDLFITYGVTFRVETR